MWTAINLKEWSTISLDDLKTLLVELDVENIANAVQDRIDTGVSPQDILAALTDGMNEIGTRYEQGEYFLTELVLAGETMKEAFEVIKPHLSAEAKSERATIVLATVKGDNHDIGKNILATMLLSAGFDVIDLGMDCSEEKIVEAVREHSARVVGLSCLLTMTMKEIAVVNQALESAGLRNGVSLIVGGAPLSLEKAKELGADDYGPDAIEGVKRIRKLLEA